MRTWIAWAIGFTLGLTLFEWAWHLWVETMKGDKR